MYIFGSEEAFGFPDGFFCLMACLFQRKKERKEGTAVGMARLRPNSRMDGGRNHFGKYFSSKHSRKYFSVFFLKIIHGWIRGVPTA